MIVKYPVILMRSKISNGNMRMASYQGKGNHAMPAYIDLKLDIALTLH